MTAVPTLHHPFAPRDRVQPEVCNSYTCVMLPISCSIIIDYDPAFPIAPSATVARYVAAAAPGARAHSAATGSDMKMKLT